MFTSSSITKTRVCVHCWCWRCLDNSAWFLYASYREWTSLSFDMKTEESKLKASFTKEMAANSTTSSSCTVKVPVLVHSSPKPPHRPCVYQAKLPKPKATPSSCTSIKNPWVMWSAVVFAAVVIIVVFASLQGKTSADLRNTKHRVTKLESLVAALQKNIVDLEVR